MNQHFISIKDPALHKIGLEWTEEPSESCAAFAAGIHPGSEYRIYIHKAAGQPSQFALICTGEILSGKFPLIFLTDKEARAAAQQHYSQIATDSARFTSSQVIH